MEEIKITSFVRDESRFDEKEMRFETLVFMLTSQPSSAWSELLKNNLVGSHFLNPYHFHFEDSKILISTHWVALNGLQDFVTTLQQYFSQTNKDIAHEHASLENINITLTKTIDNLKF